VRQAQLEFSEKVSSDLCLLLGVANEVLHYGKAKEISVAFNVQELFTNSSANCKQLVQETTFVWLRLQRLVTFCL